MIIRIHELLQSFPLGSYSCVGFGVALLLLLSIVDMLKLEFGLAPYTLTAGVGALILAVIIKKYWVTQRSLSNINKYRKLESLHQSRLRPDKVQESTDPVDIFSLPQYLRVMVSNYQPLQTIFAITEDECHTQQINNNEQFFPTVTIVDTSTQQPLDCVLLLHSDKPPEVNCRTLFCYIAVQITVDPYYCTHDSQLYQVKSKPCKQGKLPLIFCFYWSGTVCIIRLLIHSIADSEGVEYMHNSEACDCIVQIINRNQHEVVKMTDRHGVVRIKEPPRLRYTGPLASKQFHKLERQFIKLYLSPGYEHKIQQLSKQILVENSISDDIKVFALCWEAISVAYNETMNMLKNCSELLGKRHHNWNVKMAYCYKQKF